MTNEAKLETCLKCNGTGVIEWEYCGLPMSVHCYECKGHGKVEVKHVGTTKPMVTCDRCSGRGMVTKPASTAVMSCPKCDGFGLVPETTTTKQEVGETMETKEAVQHPKHYNEGKYEVIDVIEDWKLGFNDGNAVKYIGRHRHKSHPGEDLKKALWYITRELVVAYNTPTDELAQMVLTVVNDRQALQMEEKFLDMETQATSNKLLGYPSYGRRTWEGYAKALELIVKKTQTE